MEKSKNSEMVSFRISKKLLKKVDELAKIIGLNVYNTTDYHATRSYAIRLAIWDTMDRFFGPKDDPDNIESSNYKKTSKLIPLLKMVRLRKKLENITEDKEKVEKIIREMM